MDVGDCFDRWTHAIEALFVTLTTGGATPLQYVFVIRARIHNNVDMYSKPLRTGASTSTAEALTALVTTES